MSKSSEIVAALDVGTTKVCCVVGRKDENGKIEILGAGKAESVGVLRGVVSNIEKTVKAIEDAVAEASRRSNVDIRVAHVGIAGQHIKSQKHKGVIVRETGNDVISQMDIDRLVSDMFRLSLPAGDKIIHAIPQEFTVDSETGITDPVGISGVRVEAMFHIITGQAIASRNLIQCVERAGLVPASLTLEPIASAMAALSEEEKEAGVALVDIGGGTTDVIIYHNGIIRHTAVIPFGGSVITKDVKEGCSIMQQQAELLKVTYGSALAEELREDRIITISGIRGKDPKEIAESNLALIVQARMEDIFDHVFWEIRRSGYERKLIGGIVITGGGSQLRHLLPFVEYHTGLSARIGYPNEHLAHGYDPALNNPAFATAIGLLINGIEEQAAVAAGSTLKSNTGKTPEQQRQQQTEASGKKPANLINNLFRKAKEWLEADPDKDF